MFETFDHTADLGLRIVADDLNALFAEAGKALFSIIVDNFEAIAPTTAQTVAIAGADREYLLFDWLRELLYRFDADHWLFSEFDVEVNADGLTATIWGELLVRDRHQLGHEVKAITYHELKVESTSTGWLAEVIVDI
jgi:SHS2 domain-containing protein